MIPVFQMTDTKHCKHYKPGAEVQQPLNVVIEEMRSEIEQLKADVPALRAEVADLKADMERMFQAIRNLQTTTQPLNVYGGIKNE